MLKSDPSTDEMTCWWLKNHCRNLSIRPNDLVIFSLTSSLVHGIVTVAHSNRCRTEKWYQMSKDELTHRIHTENLEWIARRLDRGHDRIHLMYSKTMKPKIKFQFWHTYTPFCPVCFNLEYSRYIDTTNRTNKCSAIVFNERECKCIENESYCTNICIHRWIGDSIFA